MIGALTLYNAPQVHPRRRTAADCHKQSRDPQTWRMFFHHPGSMFLFLLFSSTARDLCFFSSLF